MLPLEVHFYRDQGTYNRAPNWIRSFDYQIDMSDGVVLQGVWPNVEGDFDADGKADCSWPGMMRSRCILPPQARYSRARRAHTC